MGGLDAQRLAEADNGPIQPMKFQAVSLFQVDQHGALRIGWKLIHRRHHLGRDVLGYRRPLGLGDRRGLFRQGGMKGAPGRVGQDLAERLAAVGGGPG